MTTLKVVSVFAIVITAITLCCLFLYAYWLLASWLVDGVMGFNGFTNVLIKVVLFLVILSFMSALSRVGKKS